MGAVRPAACQCRTLPWPSMPIHSCLEKLIVCVFFYWRKKRTVRKWWKTDRLQLFFRTTLNFRGNSISLSLVGGPTDPSNSYCCSFGFPKQNPSSHCLVFITISRRTTPYHIWYCATTTPEPTSIHYTAPLQVRGTCRVSLFVLCVLLTNDHIHR